jgi:YegS/Rv2252/BmrU family lipid kinase
MLPLWNFCFSRIKINRINSHAPGRPAVFALDSGGRTLKKCPVRACVIFNPTARGEKAKRFRRNLDLIAGECALKQTVSAGGARGLAAEAVSEGFDTVVAAGGDGTLNEVLNGIGDAPDGFARVRLGVLPLGTVNVFARELGLPMNLKESWAVLRAGKESLIDLARVECVVKGTPQQRYFAQLAGAGLDARAIDLVDWQLKKKIGPLAYVWAGLVALREMPSQITATNGANSATGELVLVGNGRFYGGSFRIFPQASLSDGLLEVCVVPKVNWLNLANCGMMLLLRGELAGSSVRSFQARSFTLTSPTVTPLEVDGESIGHLPATFSIEPKKLRVLVP